MAMTFAGNMIAVSVFATAGLGAILPVVVFVALFLAVQPNPSPRTSAWTVEGIAGRVVLAEAFRLAIFAPQSQRASWNQRSSFEGSPIDYFVFSTNVTVGSSVSGFALAFFRSDASAMKAVLGTDRYASVFGVALRVSFAAIFYRSSTDEILVFVNRFEFDFVLWATRWEVEAPDVFTDLIWLLFRHSNCGCVPKIIDIWILYEVRLEEA